MFLGNQASEHPDEIFSRIYFGIEVVCYDKAIWKWLIPFVDKVSYKSELV